MRIIVQADTVPNPHPDAAPLPEHRAQLRAAQLALLVATVLLAVKFEAFAVTGSQAIFSDALESIVNVVAAALLITGLRFAVRPADREHPFGHGKIEFFAAAFEGGLIFFAALVILWQAGLAFWSGAAPREIDFGIVLMIAAGAGNGVLGLYLVRFGRRVRSSAIEADGLHVLSDFWTSLGAVVGLLLVRLTGLPWFDPLTAAATAVLLLVTGWRVIRRAAGGLLDEEDPELLAALVALLTPRTTSGIIRVHQLRAIRSGHFRHISAHLVVPEFWTVERAHDIGEELAAELSRELPGDSDVTFHTDPCGRIYCEVCDLDACTVRRRPFAARRPLTVEEVVRADPELR
jgi:cation diffusion facilitator family transporter